MNLAYSVLVRQERSSIKKHLGEQDIGFATPDGGAFPIHILQSRVQQANESGQCRVFITLM